MRNNWNKTIVSTVVAACCACAGLSGGPLVAQQSYPQQSQLATPQLAPQQPSLMQRVSTSISSVIPGMGSQQVAQAPVQPPAQHDPISLGFASGPPNAALYMSMARLSDQGGNANHARSMYQKALSLEPNHRDALLGLARLEDRQGRMNEALGIYQFTAAKYPHDAKVLNDLALCFARTGQLPASAQLLDQASRLQPSKKLYRNNFAKVLIELNQIDHALAQLATVHPPAVAHYNMGVLLNDRGRTGDAVRFLTASTHIDPQLQAASALLTQINGGSSQLAQSPLPGANDHILPTPMPAQTAGVPYPTSNAPGQPAIQTVPAETAQVPLGDAPVLLPPVR